MNNMYMIREAVPDDAEKMISYLNQVGGESDNLLHGENGFTVPIEGVKRKLAMSKDSENSIVLIALENEQIIARAELDGYYAARIRHRAKFSISVKGILEPGNRNRNVKKNCRAGKEDEDQSNRTGSDHR